LGLSNRRIGNFKNIPFKFNCLEHYKLPNLDTQKPPEGGFCDGYQAILGMNHLRR
jgi:hypothetical protein